MSQCNKSVELFTLIRKFDIDVMTISEHGLNPRGIKPNSQWNERIKGQFENFRSPLAWNATWENVYPQMWGGMGYIIQGGA